MDFPHMLYRFPATRPDAAPLQDGLYDTSVVDDAEGFEAGIADGWFPTPGEARAAGDLIAAQKAKDAAAAAEAKKLEDAQALVAAAAAEKAPATREELEAKATELGIKFDGRTSDKKLGDLIAAQLEE